jgi:hypothetical protein
LRRATRRAELAEHDLDQLADRRLAAPNRSKPISDSIVALKPFLGNPDASRTMMTLLNVETTHERYQRLYRPVKTLVVMPRGNDEGATVKPPSGRHYSLINVKNLPV